MSNDWIHTRRGVTLVEGTLPRLAKALEALTEEVKRANDKAEAAEVMTTSSDEPSYQVLTGPEGATGTVITRATERGIEVEVVWPGGVGPDGDLQDFEVVEKATVFWGALRACGHKRRQEDGLCADCGYAGHVKG